MQYAQIVAAADAIVLSRGSMGNCLDPEKMFLAQKLLLAVRGAGDGGMGGEGGAAVAAAGDEGPGAAGETGG